MDHLRHLRSRITVVPKQPGVYRWLDENGEVLYVGKAKDLRIRMRSYLNIKEKAASPWKRALQEKIRDFEFTLTQSELEALILETNLIKELRPKFNVLMKDDKNYVYVRVTIGDPYPRVDIRRRMEDKKSKYFGPFTKAWDVKERLEMLHELWGWRACGKMDRNHPCLEFQIGKCNGLCMGKVSQEEYRSRIEKIMRFLRGDHKEAILRLQELMDEAAAQKKFERAVRYRDLLGRLKTREKQVVSDTSRENVDVIGMAVHKNKVQVVLLRERNGRLIGELSFVLVGTFETPASALEQFMEQYYSDAPDLPDEIIVGEELEDVLLLEKWLNKVRIHIPERGKRRKLLKMAEFNAVEKLKQQFASFEQEKAERTSALKELKDALHLKKIPRRIEGYDISHLSGTETVGSMVVFQGGKPENDQYRSFTVRTLHEGDIDDYAALREVLERRIKYLADTTYREALDGKRKPPDVSLGKTPDLLVVDGGKGQLGVAVKVLKECALDIPVIALAKREEEVFRPDDPLPVALADDAPALFLLMRIRDEAHRRANLHRENRHRKETIRH